MVVVVVVVVVVAAAMVPNIYTFYWSSATTAKAQVQNQKDPCWKDGKSNSDLFAARQRAHPAGLPLVPVPTLKAI